MDAALTWTSLSFASTEELAHQPSGLQSNTLNNSGIQGHIRKVTLLGCAWSFSPMPPAQTFAHSQTPRKQPIHKHSMVEICHAHVFGEREAATCSSSTSSPLCVGSKRAWKRLHYGPSDHITPFGQVLTHIIHQSLPLGPTLPTTRCLGLHDPLQLSIIARHVSDTSGSHHPNHTGRLIPH